MRSRVGIIGLGFGQNVLVPAFRMDPRCEVAGLGASDESRAAEAAHRLQVPKAYGDWRQMVSDPSLDVIAIAVPPRLQPAIALGAIGHGKHVFCEKPLGVQPEDSGSLLAAAEKAGVVHLVDFEFCVLDTWQKLKDLLAAHALGALRQVMVSWHLETFAHRQGIDSWKRRAAEGGGALHAFASHTFYYLEWLFGPITRLFAHLHPPDGKDALVMLCVELARGTQASISIGANSFLGRGHRLEVYGEGGTAVLENRTADYIKGFELKVGTRTHPHLETVCADSIPTAIQDGRIFAVGRMVNRFFDWLQNGKRQSPNLADGHRVQFLLDRARRSASADAWQPASPCPAETPRSRA